ncbi:shikimate kinase [Methanolapillus ohkumae]|uniref:Shikimate kinase n=1 Tax=Methanolapillus ohkumae TaxID=3028298 RepID=A0AA96VF90_9EURY|nr:Shikimate kinase [Methanosarcinaceae archaeon Am2]
MTSKSTHSNEKSDPSTSTNSTSTNSTSTNSNGFANFSNIVLIGMPGAGKSTTGVLLAKTLCMSFLDTDLIIQEKTGMFLQDLVDRLGFSGFTNLEEEILLDIEPKNAVISTGGSVIYSEKAMKRLKKIGTIIYFDVSFPEIVHRIQNISTRGIALHDGQTLKDLYEERRPLYEKYADLTFSGDKKTVEEMVEEIAMKLKK